MNAPNSALKLPLYEVLSILKSGCEVILHCNANMKEMVQIHSSIPLIKNTTLKKINKLSNLR